MSVEQVRAALECRADLPSTAAHVLLILATYTDAEGRRAFPSVPTIARQAHMGARTVQRALRVLASAGLVTVAERSQGSLPTCYTLHLTPVTQTPAKLTPPATVAPGRGANQSQRGANNDIDPRHSGTQSVMDQSVKQDAGARARESAPHDSRPREWRDAQGRLYASPGNGSEALDRERAQRAERQRASETAPESAAPAPQQGEVISAVGPPEP